MKVKPLNLTYYELLELADVLERVIETSLKIGVMSGGLTAQILHTVNRAIEDARNPARAETNEAARVGGGV